MSFKCPVCQSTLTKDKYEGTNIYPCSNGCGIFLGRGNLKIIEESREQIIPMSSVSKATDDRGSVKACPKCQELMAKRNHGELNSTVIDYCSSCQGVWLDPGELERIQVFYEAAQEFNDPHQFQEPEFECPKCKAKQVKGVECVRCGLLFAQYEVKENDAKSVEKSKNKNSSELENVFQNLQHLVVDQKFHLTEALLGFERCNSYKLTLFPTDIRQGNWRIEEENLSTFSILGRNIFGLLFTSTMHMKDGLGNIVLRLHRKPRLYFHELEVYDENGVEFGLVKRNFSFFNRVVSVRNVKGNRLLKIVGPIWKPWTFNVYEGKRKVAVITKKWTGLLKEAYTDADRFNLEFTDSLSYPKKRLSIAALMLIDSLYFEGKKNFSQHFISAPGLSLVVFLVTLIGAYYYYLQ